MTGFSTLPEHLTGSLEPPTPWRTAAANVEEGSEGGSPFPQVYQQSQAQLCSGSPLWGAQVDSARARAWLCVDPSTGGNRRKPLCTVPAPANVQEAYPPTVTVLAAVTALPGNVHLLSCRT